MNAAIRILIALGSILLLSACGEERQAIATTAPTLIQWLRMPALIAGVLSNYTPWLIIIGEQIRVFLNTATGDQNDIDGKWYRRDGNFNGVGNPILCLVIDDPENCYIRTAGVAKGASGKLYALLRTGSGYPTNNGYAPSLAISDNDGVTWNWLGSCSTPFGRFQSDSGTLIVDESRNDDYRFMSWETGTGIPLVMIHSADGMNWTSDKQNIWPIEGENPNFPSAVKTPFGYHIIAANTWPAAKHRHIFSRNGFAPWTLIDADSPTLNGNDKGTNLTYDLTTNKIHALTRGGHWVVEAKDFIVT